MKRCPECRRDYYDDSLLYCLDDGAGLLEGPATAEPIEPATALLGGSDPRTAILNSGESSRLERTGGGLGYKIFAAALALLIIGAMGIAVYKYLVPAARAAHFASSQDLKISKLTDSGRISDIAISPDGR